MSAPTRLRIEHATGFRYDGDIGASYNEARMLPSSSENQFVLNSQLEIDPSASVNQFIDYFGTRVASFDVLAPHRELSIVARSLVEVRHRPFERSGIGWEELAAEAARAISTVEMLGQTARTAPHAEVRALAQKLARKHPEPSNAAIAISEAIRDKVAYVKGVTGVHSTAAEAWAARKGVCQDIVHLTLGALREVGIPARYVSGYLHPDRDAGIGVPVAGESHAWVEWFAGVWQAFDPTNGSEIGTHHVLVGRGRDYSDVPPLRGVYAGPFTSALHVEVTITREA